MKNIILFCCVLLMIQACKEAPKQRPQAKKTAKAAVPVKAASSPSRYRSQAIPYDTIYPAYILTAGPYVYHNDEVDPKYATHKWMGLFKADSNYYTAQTKVKITPGFDEMVDEGGTEKTGWAVKPAVKDSAILLITGLDHLRPAKVSVIAPNVQMIMPDSTKTFAFKGIVYTLYATGKNRATGTDGYDVINYKLFIKATINGVSYNQLLADVSAFDDAMITIQFVGDIDGDGRPDLIIDTTDHYNVNQPTLYLSAPAETGKLLKIVGVHTYVGC